MNLHASNTVAFTSTAITVAVLTLEQIGKMYVMMRFAEISKSTIDIFLTFGKYLHPLHYYKIQYSKSECRNDLYIPARKQNYEE